MLGERESGPLNIRADSVITAHIIFITSLWLSDNKSGFLFDGAAGSLYDPIKQYQILTLYVHSIFALSTNDDVGK